MRFPRVSFWILCASMSLLPAAGQCTFNKSAPGLFLESAGAIPPAAPAAGKKKTANARDENDPVVLTADEMGYDQEHGIVIARGHVEAEQGSSILHATQVTYFEGRDVVLAEGDVSLLQPTGDVMFADRAELTDAMKKGVITAFKARLADNSVFVARTATKVNAAVTKLDDAKYTPCDICANMAPFWQLNAGDVKIDEGTERVTYHDATMNMFGYPVFYTPYLSHPTPDSTAKSGFLSPQYANSTNLGTLAKAPIYWRIDDDKDVVITPWYTQNDGPVLQEDYRQLTDHGQYHIQGTMTNPDKVDTYGNPTPGHQFRGYLNAQGLENIDDTSDIGFDIERTTDQTFLRRYSLGDQSSLFSRLFVETAENRNYGLIQGLAIQGLRVTDDTRTTPLILPSIQSYYETRPDEYGIRYHISEDIQSLTRDIGVDQSRISLTAGASLPYVTDSGHIFTTTLNLRQDAYRTSHITVDGVTEDANSYRTLPQGAVEWRYPLINHIGDGNMTIEPVVLGVVQANGGNPATISNEDSRLLELSDTNIFSLNRMPGLDLVDSGARVAYGARSQYLFSDGTSADALFGQNYSVDGDTPFPNSSTPGEHFSDYVGRLALSVNTWTLAYSFALDKEELGLNRSEVGLTFAKPWLTVTTSYTALDKNPYITDSKEGQVDVAFPVTDNWSLHGGARRDFDLHQLVSENAGFIYKNECFNIMFDAVRNFTSDRDVAASTEYLVRFGFKNLGEFGGK